MAITAASVAATATTVAAAASTANAAYQASKAGAGAGAKPPRVQGLTKNQQLFNRSTQHILDQEQALLANAASQGVAANAEIYKKLGYEPTYDGPAPDYARMKSEQDQAHSDAVTAFTEWQKAKKTGKGVKQANAKLSAAKALFSSKADAYNSALANPRQITGLNRLPNNADGTQAGHDPKNPDDLMQVALDLQNQTLIRALKGEEPIDSTLTHSFEVGENNLRDKLRRQLGPDYETSTAGSEALSAFDRQKGEAFESFNRQTVDLFSKLTESHALALSNMTTQQISNMLTPTRTMLSIAGAMGQSAEDRNKYIGLQMDWRAKQAGINVGAYNAQTSRLDYGRLGAQDQNGYIQQALGGVVAGADDLKDPNNPLAKYLGNSSNSSPTNPHADAPITIDSGGFSGDSSGAGYSGVGNPYAL